MARARARYEITARDKTKAAIKSAQAGFSGLNSTALKLSAGIGTLAGVGGFGALVAVSLKSADALAKQADKLGITTQALAGLRHAAELTGVGANTMDMALQRMTRRLAEAAQGTGEAKNAIKELGLDARALAAQSPDQAFRTITQAMQGVENQSDKVRLAFKLFDSEGVGLVNTMAGGVEALDEYAREVELLGVALDRVDAAKIEAANDSIYRVQQAAKGAGQQFAVALAPYIEASAKWLLEAAKQAGGFRKIAVNAVEGAVQSFAKLADALHIVQAGWLTLKAAFQGIGALVNTSLSTVINGPIYLINQAVEAVNDLIRGANRLPGIDLPEVQIDLKPFGQLEGASRASKEAVAQTWDELQALLDQGWPSDGVNAWFANIKAQAEQAAEKVAEVRPGGAAYQGAPAIPPGVSRATGQETDKERDRLQSGIDSLSTALMTEEQRLAESLERRSFMVEAAFQNGVINEQRRKELLQQVEKDHQDKLSELVKKGYDDRAKFAALSTGAQAKHVLGELAGLTAGVAQHDKRMFKLNKAAAIGNAVVNTYQGVSKSLATYPMPLAGFMAAAHLAAGLAQVRAIKSAQFGGGASGGGVSGGGGTVPSQIGTTPAATTQPVQSQQQPPQITIHVAEGGTIVGNPEQVAELVAQGLSLALESDMVSADVDIRVVA